MNERTSRVALLIDADNLSADVIEQAVEHLLETQGSIHFRRAYCSPQKAIELMEVFRRHAIRPMVNVPTGKNSTDIALAVDAIDLALSEHPDVMVIASSDSDYAPLAQRLREKGCRVLGIGQAGKTGSESPLAYDGFIDLAHRKARASAKAPPSGSRSRSRSREVAAMPVLRPPLPLEVASILKAVPELLSGDLVSLGGIGESLRKEGLLKSKSASPSRLLKRHGAYFELLPADKPRNVRYLEASGG